MIHIVIFRLARLATLQILQPFLLFADCKFFKPPISKSLKFQIYLENFQSFLFTNHQAFKFSNPKNSLKNINSEKRQIFKLYDFIGRLKLIYFSALKIGELQTFQSFKREYITFCLSIYNVGFCCNEMLCFAPIFFIISGFFDGFECSSESFQIENTSTNYRIYRHGKSEQSAPIILPCKEQCVAVLSTSNQLIYDVEYQSKIVFSSWSESLKRQTDERRKKNIDGF